MAIEMTLEHYNAIVDEFLNALDRESKNIAKEIEKILLQQIRDDAERAYNKIIDNWYASYSPSVYHRKYTLKNAGRFNIVGDSVEIIINSDPLSGHRLGNEGIYQLTMREGYHGGALNSTYMYRGPVNEWYYWTRSAEKSFSPVRAMKNWAHSYNTTHEQIKQVEKIVRKYLSKYEYFRLFY